LYDNNIVDIFYFIMYFFIIIILFVNNIILYIIIFISIFVKRGELLFIIIFEWNFCVIIN